MEQKSLLTASNTNATLTIRLIRSFEFKTFRNLILYNLDLTRVTLQDLNKLIKANLESKKNLKFLLVCPFDTFKIHAQPHGAKTSNPIISTENDERLILENWNVPLVQLGLDHESELSYFVRSEYEAYKTNPTFRWE